MTSAAPRLSRVIAAIAFAAAPCVPAIAAPIVSGEVFVKLPAGAGGRDHGGQIEVESFSWGGAAATGIKDVEALRQVDMVGAPQAAGRDLGGWSKAEGLDVNMSPSATRGRGGTNTVDRNEKITIHGQSSASDPDRPVIIGRLPNPPAASVGASQSLSVGANRSQQMQYNPKEYSVSKSNNWATARRATPLARGSVWLRMSSPWTACRVGTRYPSLELGGGGKTYVLRDVTVASCGRSGDADDRPTEEVAFYYNSIG